MWRSIALIIVIFTLGCSGLRLPPTGRFAFSGAPDLATGAWKAVDLSPDPMVVLAAAHAGGQVSQRQSRTGEVITTVIKYTSHQCVDENTFYATTEGISYPSMFTVRQCGIYFINATHRASNNLPLDGGVCPNAAFVGYNLNPNGAFLSSNIYDYIDGVITPSPEFVCRNRSDVLLLEPLPDIAWPTTIAAASSSLKPASAPPAAPVTTYDPASNITSPYEPWPKSGGPATALGVWKAPNIVEILTRDGVFASVYDPLTGTLLARRSKYLSYKCFGQDAYKATAQQYAIYLNGSSTGWTDSCEAGHRGNMGNTLDIAVAQNGAPCPMSAYDTANTQAALTFSFSLIETLSGNPSTECGATSSAHRASQPYFPGLIFANVLFIIIILL